MTKTFVPVAVALSLMAGSLAHAATPAAAAKPVTSAKAAECAKQWKAQKTHTQTRKAFLAACEKG